MENVASRTEPGYSTSSYFNSCYYSWSAVWRANEAKGSIWYCLHCDMQTRRKGQAGIVLIDLASFVGSIASRCSEKCAQNVDGHERAAEIEPTSLACFLKTKECLIAGSTVITAIACTQHFQEYDSK